MYPNYPDATYVFRIYIAGGTPDSGRALARLYAICQKHFPKNHRILIVDVLNDPLRVLADEIMVTPTVIKVSPNPEMKIIGNFGDEELD